MPRKRGVEVAAERIYRTDRQAMRLRRRTDVASLSEHEISQLDGLLDESSDESSDGEGIDESIESRGTDPAEIAAQRLSAQRFLAAADASLRRVQPGRLVVGPGLTTLKGLIRAREMALAATGGRVDGDDR